MSAPETGSPSATRAACEPVSGGAAGLAATECAAGDVAAERPLRRAEPCDQRIVGEDVDAPRDAAGGLGDQPGGTRRHHLRHLVGAADPQTMLDIFKALLDAERPEAGAQRDALR